MTGEMAWIKPDGTDSNGDVYDVHAKVARALRCRLRPFDKYIGPYIAHKAGKLWLSVEDDGFLGSVCLWPGGVAPAYREPVVVYYRPFNDAEAATAAARQAVKQSKKANS